MKSRTFENCGTRKQYLVLLTVSVSTAAVRDARADADFVRDKVTVHRHTTKCTPSSLAKQKRYWRKYPTISEILTKVFMKIKVLWAVTPCVGVIVPHVQKVVVPSHSGSIYGISSFPRYGTIKANSSPPGNFMLFCFLIIRVFGSKVSCA